MTTPDDANHGFSDPIPPGYGASQDRTTDGPSAASPTPAPALSESAESPHQLPSVPEFAAPAHPVAAPATWLEEPEAGEGVSLLGILHALRRRWLPASLIGATLASLVALALWFIIPVKYEAQAWLRVKREAKDIVGDKGYIKSTDRTYEVYKSTQRDLLTNPFVLASVVRDKKVMQIQVVREQDDPIEWLSDEIEAVTSPETEMIRLSMSGTNQGDPKTIVDAVLDAYRLEVLDKERRTKQDTLTQLNKAFTTKQQDLQDKQIRFKELSKESIGISTDSEAARLQQNMMLMDLREMAQMREDVRRRMAEASRNMEMIRASVKAGQSRPDQFLVLDILETDPDYFFQKQKVDELEKEIRFYSNVMSPGSSQMARLQQQLGGQKQELERIRKEKTPRVLARIQRGQGLDDYSVGAVIAPLKASMGHLRAEYAAIDKNYMEMREEFKKLMDVSNEIITLHNDILNLKAFLFQLSDEREKVQVNLNQPERVQIVQRAFVPKLSGNWMKRLMLMAIAWSGVFGLTVAGITLWDYQAKRVNSTKDVEGITAGIRVVGSLPMLNHGGTLWPFGKMNQRSMEVVLNFSVDSIRASLLFNQSKEAIKVVMVTSARGQEGRTTLASQLAVSLARSGRNTVIVDADMRNPQQHYVFGTGGERGFCDALRGESIDHCIESTAVENLTILPAGRYDQRSTQALASEAAKKVFDDLRGRFDFVIIDVGPALTSADALLLGQQVDTAMISVRRDVSQIPKVYDACDRLRSVGVHIIGAVVHGAGTEIRPDELKIASSVAALPDSRSEPEFSGADV